MPEAPPRAPLVTDAIPPRLRRTGTTPGGVLLMCVIGTLVLGLFASRDLVTWTQRFADTPGAPTAQRLVEKWDGWMADWGLVRPHETLRSAVARLVDMGWNGGPND
jgi:hypothetical protein